MLAPKQNVLRCLVILMLLLSAIFLVCEYQQTVEKIEESIALTATMTKVKSLC